MSQVDAIPDEAPPAYTPSADTRHGEATVELGPRRPFQQAPAPFLTPQSTSTPSLLNQNRNLQAPQRTGQSSLGGDYPGRASRSTASLSSADSRRTAFQPPPRHPSTASSFSSSTVSPASNRHSTGSSQRSLSEFARDFYNAGSADPEENIRSSTASGNGSYQPPSSPPPRSPLRSSYEEFGFNSSFAPPAEPPPSTSSQSQSQSSEEFTPTRSPTPGRPLLNRGRALIYPANYTCTKCRNTGYKNNDPSHPCQKCWDKYSKPYNGAMLYADWNPSAAGNSQLQRPLPNYRPPQASYIPSPTSPSPQWSSNTNTMPRSVSSPVVHTRGAPPPGAAIVQPGDPRIGGRLCWRCNGDGWVSFLIFDRETCPVCKGVGRILT